MLDVVYLLAASAFFVIAFAYITACQKLRGQIDE